MRKHWMATCVVAALAADFVVPGVAWAYEPVPAGMAGYAPVQQPSWTDRVESTLQAPFRSVAAAWKGERPPRPDSISLERGIGPATPQLFTSMAAMHERNGDLQQARLMYQRALELDPRHTDAMIGAARLEDRCGQLDAALAWYQRAAATNPQDATIANDFGLCLARSGQVQESLTPLAQAIRLDPQKPLYRNNIAKVLMALDRPAEAADQLAAVHSPAAVNYNMAVLLLDADRVAEAARCLQLATTLDPQLTAASDLLALLQEPSGDPSLAGTASADGVARTAQRSPIAQPAVEESPISQPWPAANAAAALAAAVDEKVLPTPSENPPATYPSNSAPMLLPPID
ncbi:MAG: tetratricopeptide repeat protein [Pirellulales bacterium]|nr:tetratricopeptide repeat protein [Pirellulales bacterium]